MAAREILLLGDPKLYQLSKPVSEEEILQLPTVVADLRDTLIQFRNTWGGGRAIAAPQIGVMKRIVYLHFEQPAVFINPVLSDFSAATVELWDYCMSFPELYVRVQRAATCLITYRDLEWQEQQIHLDGWRSELLQHECDHLDGILAVSRAIDDKSFGLRSQRHLFLSET